MPSSPQPAEPREAVAPPRRELFIAGTASFAAEVADWARHAGFQVCGLIEMLDPNRAGERRHELPVVALEEGGRGLAAVLGLGGDRREAWDRLAASGWAAVSVVHPSAAVAADALLQTGATVGPLAAIGASSTVGEHAIVSRGTLVGHHVGIGAFATLNPGANLGGNTTIGTAAFVGMGATVVNGVTIGDGAVIAAGAVVLADVEPGTRVQGVPARPIALETS